MNFDSNIRPLARNGLAAWRLRWLVFFSPRGVSIDCAIFQRGAYECSIIQKETG